jgi:hypothetical protein
MANLETIKQLSSTYMGSRKWRGEKELTISDGFIHLHSAMTFNL